MKFVHCSMHGDMMIPCLSVFEKVWIQYHLKSTSFPHCLPQLFLRLPAVSHLKSKTLGCQERPICTVNGKEGTQERCKLEGSKTILDSFCDSAHALPDLLLIDPQTVFCQGCIEVCLLIWDCSALCWISLWLEGTQMGKWKWPNISKDLPRVEFPVPESNLASIFSLAMWHQAKWNVERKKTKHERGGATCLFALCGMKKSSKVSVWRGIQCVWNWYPNMILVVDQPCMPRPRSLKIIFPSRFFEILGTTWRFCQKKKTTNRKIQLPPTLFNPFW